MARYREEGGPNVHHHVIRIPADLRTGVAVHPFADPQATLVVRHAGPVVWQTEAFRALCLEASVGGVRRVQWMREGFGEIWIGDAEGAPMRWARGGWIDEALRFGEDFHYLRAQPLPGLPPNQ